LKMMSNLGISCPSSHLAALSTYAESMEWVFWPTAMALLGWKPDTPKDHRQSLWALTTMTRRGYRMWPTELVKQMEDTQHIYTISDLMERAKGATFEQTLCENATIKKYWSLVKSEVDYRKTQPRSRTPSPERIEMNGEIVVSLVHNKPENL
jgi:hypothetical protein